MNQSFGKDMNFLQPKDAWDSLSMYEKAAMMKVAVKNGIYNLKDIRQKYNEFAEGGDTDNLTPWKALQNIDYVEVPDTAFTREKTGAGSIEVMFKDTPKEGYIYGTGYKYPHPKPGHNVVIYNPKENDAQDIRLDALHIMPQDATYDALRSELAYYADNSDISNNAKDRMEEDIRKYGHLIPGMSYQDYYNNEVDGFLRNMFIEGSPEYIQSKRYYPNLQQLRDWNKELLPYVDRIHNYLITGQRPANILPEIIIAGKKHSIGGPLVEAAINEYNKGGSIHIKPSHRGRLTELKKRTGKTEAELYNDGNPAHKKMVVFARSARKWKHGYGGNLFDGTTQPTQKMQIGLNVQGWPDYSLEEVVAYGDENERRRKAIQDAYLNFVIESNDATVVANGRLQNQHLVDKAVRGAKANAAWEKEHPHLTAWSYLPNAAVIGTALAPLGAAGWSGLTALGDAAAATTAGQAITSALAPVATAATTEYAGAPAWMWAEQGLNSLFAGHGLSTAIEEGGISPTTALEMLPLGMAGVQGSRMAYNSTKPYVNQAVESLQNNYPALFDPYTSWDATLGYHGNNLFSRAIGTVGRRYGYTPKAEIPEFHRRLNINRPSQLKLDDSGNMIISSGRTGEGHDGIVNFATSEPARGHSNHKSLSGIDDYIIDSKAIGTQDFKSIQPSDTFFETGQLAIDPKSMTLVSGNTEMLDYARSLGMRTLSSPRLRQLTGSRMTKEDVINSRSEGIAKFLQNVGDIKYGRGSENAGQIGEEMQRLTSMRGTPTMQDYSYFEGLTGLNSGVRPAEMWNGTSEHGWELFGNWGRPRRLPTFNHVAYAPASNIEAIYREAKIGKRPWSDYYEALEKMPSARSQTGDLLDWSAENWLGRRVGGYDAEDVAALKRHVPEYLEIEKQAKANGTWLKNADGSDWAGFINSRGKISKDPHVWVMQQSKAGQAWTNEMLGTGMKSERVTGFPTYNGELWVASTPKVPQTFMSELKEPDFTWKSLFNRIRHGYIPQWKMDLERMLDLQKGRAFGITVPRDMKTLQIDAEGRDWNRVTPVGEGSYMTTRDYVKDFLGGENQAIRINNVNEWHRPFGINTDDLILGKGTPRKIWEGNNGDLDPLIINGYKAFGGYLTIPSKK